MNFYSQYYLHSTLANFGKHEFPALRTVLHLAVKTYKKVEGESRVLGRQRDKMNFYSQYYLHFYRFPDN